MRTCVSCSGKILNVMQSISNEQLADMLRFVEHQAEFVLETTADVKTYHDFLTTTSGMVLFNSTCMCLQTIGETIRQVDDITAGNLFARYPSTPWKQIIGMRNIISHEYLSVDTELIFDITREELVPMLSDLRRVLADLDSTTQENPEEGETK